MHKLQSRDEMIRMKMGLVTEDGMGMHSKRSRVLASPSFAEKKATRCAPLMPQ